MNSINLKSKLASAILMLCVGLNVNARQSTNPVTAEFKVKGNCGMCEKTIEKAANVKGVTKADWDVNTKILSVTYNNKKTSEDMILKQVAYAGYDNDKYLAPDEAYNKLHECCKYERAGKKEIPATSAKHNDPKMEDHATHQQKKNELETVYSLYFETKDALIKEDAKLAAAKSKTLLDALGVVKMEALGSKEHDVFMKHLSELKTDAGHIAESKDIEHQRGHFSSLSDRMFELMKTIQPGYTVYLDHCPMYNDGKGANWISKENGIKNPYYGSKMLTCGKVKETLK